MRRPVQGQLRRGQLAFVDAAAQRRPGRHRRAQPGPAGRRRVQLGQGGQAAVRRAAAAVAVPDRRGRRDAVVFRDRRLRVPVGAHAAQRDRARAAERECAGRL